MPSRREFIGRIAMTGSGLALAGLLADRTMVAAQAAKLDTVTITTPRGRKVNGAYARAGKPAPSVLVIHEWWGLNDHIKSMAQELANQGYNALAVDLFDGQTTDDPERAAELMSAANAEAEKGLDTMLAWGQWVRQQDDHQGGLGTIGWCFGGGWSLNASLIQPVDATVIYYGDVSKTAEELKALHGPVLGHFATEDQWINKPMVEGFEKAMKEAGKSLELYWYEADHAFANPTNARYDAPDAQLAWERSLDFFRRNLLAV